MTAQSATLGYGFRYYGFGVLVLGLVCLVWGNFEEGQPVPDGLPGYALLAHIASAWMAVAGAAVIWRRTAAWGAAALTAYYALIVVGLMYGNLLRTDYAEYFTYSGAAEEGALALAGLIVYAASSGMDAAKAARLTRFAQKTFGACALLYGGAHFVYLNLTVPLIPKWLPLSPVFWAYATGVCHILGGLGILSGVADGLAAVLLTVMFASFTPLVHVPMLRADTGSFVNWTENALNVALTGAAWVVADSLLRARRAARV